MEFKSKDGGENMYSLNNIFISISKTAILILVMYFIAFSSASFAALKGEYLFQNNLVSSVPGAPPLMDLGDGAFVAANVNGVTSTVFAFNEGEGLRLNTDGLIPNNVYTIVMLFEVADANLDDYIKILDFDDLLLDEGLYVLENTLYFYDEDQSPNLTIFSDTYAQVTLTRDALGDVVGYVNGNQEISFTDSSNYAEISAEDYLIFFRDDDSTGNSENSTGTVACIRVYDEVLSPSQIAEIDCFEEELIREVPTISEWGMIAMAGVLGLVGFMVIRRRMASA